LPTAILYVETNLVLSHAMGRDPATDELLSRANPAIRLVIPAVCFMEAFSAFEAERARHNRRVGEREQQIVQLKRNLISPRIQPLISNLARSIVELRELFNEFQGRLFEAFDHLRSSAEFIDLAPALLGASLGSVLIDDPTDNLILSCILHHAASHPEAIKAFLSENRRDFDQKPYPKAALEAAGVKYFADASKFLQWHAARPEG